MRWARAIDGALRSLARAWHWHNRRRIRPHNLKPPSRRKLLFELLEPRVLLSASPTAVATVADGVLSAHLTDHDDQVLIPQLDGNATDGYQVKVTLGTFEAETFRGVHSIIADGLDGDDSFFLVDITADVAVSVDGGAGNDALIADDRTNAWTVGASNAGTLNQITFSGVENLVGGAANDTYTFTAGAAGSVLIDEAAGGVDTLNFSAMSTAVTIDLSNTAAQEVKTGLTLTLGQGDGLENVVGGSGN